MSTFAINAPGVKGSINQGFFASADPSVGLTRSARLTRTFVVLSLTIVLVAGAAATSGAGDQIVASSPNTNSYVTVVVPSGATLWSVASAYGEGDVQAMVEAIREANNLLGYDITAGAKLRVPRK